jgi:hypothetical protein
MSTTHTPGPWATVPTTAKGAHSDTKRLDVVSHGAEFSPSFVAGDVSPSDARLIAAAPDLLEALRLGVENDIPTTEWLRIARAAIAKAEGTA